MDDAADDFDSTLRDIQSVIETGASLINSGTEIIKVDGCPLNDKLMRLGCDSMSEDA